MDGDPRRTRYEHPASDSPLSGENPTVITYKFGLNADDEPFSITAEGLPRIDYAPRTRRWIGLVH